MFSFSISSAGKRSLETDSDRVVKLVASLSVQICGMNPPFCKDLHVKETTEECALDHSILREREMTLQVRLANLAPRVPSPGKRRDPGNGLKCYLLCYIT